MSVAHTNRNIPPIQGLPPHPAQVAEQQRLAELKRTDPGLAQAQIAQATQKRSSIMPDQTREALKRLADSMRRASGRRRPRSARPRPDGGLRRPPAARAIPRHAPTGTARRQAGARDARTAPLPVSTCSR